jgi:retinol-binding protein 3
MKRIERWAAIPVFLLLAVAPATAKDLAGRWSGRMEPTNLSAEIALELARAGTAWNAALTFHAGPTDAALPVEELRVADDGLSLRTKIEGADVALQFALDDDGLLIGSVRVTEGDRVLAEGPAGLAPAGDEAAQQGLTRWLDAQGISIEPARRAAVIERAAELMLASYAFADRAALAAADVRARAARGEYDSITSPARLAELLSRHLAEATSDRHVRVKFGAERVADPLAAASTDETPDELAELRRDAEAEGFGIGATRVLEGNVGYLEMKRFLRADLAGDALAAAMQRLAGTDALIVDLRECRGGEPGMVVLVASWFFDGRPRHWNDMLRRVDGTTTQFWTAAWLPGARHANKPLYVLTAQRTFSAPESLAYELQQTKRATIVGETTGGGAHAGAWFPIDDRFAIFVPLSRYVSATSGGDWEGVGVQPDAACPAAEALERAHRAALAKLGRE